MCLTRPFARYASLPSAAKKFRPSVGESVLNYDAWTQSLNPLLLDPWILPVTARYDTYSYDDPLACITVKFGSASYALNAADFKLGDFRACFLCDRSAA